MNWVFLTRLYKKAPVSPGWLTQVFGKNVEYSPIPKVRILSESSSLSMATLGKVYDPPRPVKVATGVSELLVDPAQIYEYDEITEEMIFAENYNPSVLAINGAQDVISSKEYLYAKKVEKLKKRAVLRLEWMIAQVVSTGKISYNDGKSAYSIDYGVTAGSYTLSSSTKIYSDLKDLVATMKQNGFNPKYIIVTKEVENALWDNTQFNKAIDKNSFNLGSANFEIQKPFVTFVAKLNGLPPIYTYTGKVGETDLITGNKIIIADPDAFGLSYGAIINKNLDKNMNPVQTDVAVWEADSQEGDERYIYVKSRPLPHLDDKNGLIVKNVTIS